MTKELFCTQIGNDLCIGELTCQPEAVSVIAEEAQRFVPERTCRWKQADFITEGEWWNTECGESFTWEPYGTPNYCPNCGGKVINKAVEE